MPDEDTDAARGSVQLRLAMLSLETCLDGICWLDVLGRVVYANPAASRLLGYSPEELSRLTMNEIAPGAPAEAWGPDGTLCRALADQGTLWYPAELRHRDGSSIPVEVSAARATIDGQQFIVQTVREVAPLARTTPDEASAARREDAEADEAERHRMEVALVDMASELDRFFSVTLELLCIADAQGTIRRLNPAWERTLGYPRHELVSRSIPDLVHPDDHQATLDVIGRLSRVQTAVDFTTRCLGSDGTYHWLAWRALAAGGLIYAAANDVTSRRATAEALARATEAAEAASRAKNDFLTRVSHELRTPLNAIVGLGHLALRTELTPRQRDYLTKLNGSANALTELVDNILDFSKIEAGKLQIDSSVFRLDRLLAAVTSTVSLKAQEKGLELVARAAPDVPRRLMGDSLRLGQVLGNLLGNAVKFTEHGQVSLSAELAGRDTGTARVQFSVRDTGIGFSAEQQARLFEPFDGSAARRGGADQGGGLGLAISQQLVGLMGGELRVESVAAGGTTFSFALDLGVLEGTESPGRSVPLDLRGRRVLVVDANRADREAVAAALSGLSFQVSAFGSSEDVLDEFARPGAACDAVIVDAELPGFGCMEILQRLRGDLRLPTPPRILLSASSARPAFVRQVERFGLDGLIIKPVVASDLFDALMEAFGGLVESREKAHADPPDPASPLRGARVLLVEDNPINQRVARELLENQGMAVEVAANGREAVEAIRLGPDRFDVVLMDVQMPEMDGYAATRAIRQHWPDRVLPIIAVTANALHSEQTACLEAGMNDYLSKPVDPVRLETVLRHWLARRADAAAQGRAPAPAGDGSSAPPDAAGPLAGINVESALSRLSGNRGLLIRLLRDFVREHGESGKVIGDAIRGGDVDAALALAHGLKGVAGTLSAGAVYEEARALEMALRQGERDTLQGHIDRLADALRVVCDAVATLAPEAPARPAVHAARTPAEAGHVAALLGEFDKLLKNRRFAARRQFELIKEQVTATELRDSLEAVQAHLDRLEFQQARDLLPSIARTLGIVLS